MKFICSTKLTKLLCVGHSCISHTNRSHTLSQRKNLRSPERDRKHILHVYREFQKLFLQSRQRCWVKSVTFATNRFSSRYFFFFIIESCFFVVLLSFFDGLLFFFLSQFRFLSFQLCTHSFEFVFLFNHCRFVDSENSDAIDGRPREVCCCWKQEAVSRNVE